MYPPRPIQPAADPVVGAQRASLVAGFGHGEDEPGVQRFVQRVPRQQVAQPQTHVAVAVHRVGGRRVPERGRHLLVAQRRQRRMFGEAFEIAQRLATPQVQGPAEQPVPDRRRGRAGGGDRLAEVDDVEACGVGVEAVPAGHRPDREQRLDRISSTWRMAARRRLAPRSSGGLGRGMDDP